MKLRLLFLLLACSLAACSQGIRNTYLPLRHATRPMQLANITVCDEWPAGVDLCVYCNGQLIQQLAPQEELVLKAPVHTFELKIVAKANEQELGVIQKTYGPFDVLPSYAIQHWHFEHSSL